MLFRRRFSDLVDRQLALFGSDNADLLRELAATRRAYDLSPREESIEAYGDYADRVGWAAEELRALRNAYAESLEGRALLDYRRAFLRGIRRRFPDLVDSFLHDDDLAHDADPHRDDG